MNRRRIRHPILLLVLAIVGGVSLTALLILWRISSGISGALPHEQGALRWQGEGELEYAQVSVYRPVANPLSVSMIESSGDAIKAKLSDAGIPDAAYLIDYGAELTCGADSDGGNCSAALTLVEGDFFRLHGFRFLSGDGFRPDDVMQDRVVLDELAAWKLFSSNNCAGLRVHINGRDFYVAGVVERETDRYAKLCYGEEPRIYASYRGWYNTPGVEAGDPAPVTFCEAVLPEPVDGFAADAFVAGIGLDEDEISHNSERFRLESLWANLRGMHMQGILSNAVVYPYWESAARLAANRASLLLIPMLICLVPLTGWAIYGLLCLRRLVGAGGRGAAHLAERMVERRRTRAYLKHEAQKRRERKEEHDENE